MELEYLLIKSDNKAIQVTYQEYTDLILTQTKVKTETIIK